MLRDRARVVCKRVKRWPMHRLIRGLVRWEPMHEPEPGYTVVIAAMRRLAPIATANLRLISKMRLDSAAEILLVFDCAVEDIPVCVRDAAEELRTRTRVRLIGYNPRQRSVAWRIRWGWVYSWMSWSIGIGSVRTRHVILHDLDALPIAEGFFEDLYAEIVGSGAAFQGIRRYRGNGIDASMGLVTTFEMALDAARVRSGFRPFDGFNRAAFVAGRYVDFDTFLSMQWASKSLSLVSVDETSLVHPTQMICQHTDFMCGRDPMTKTLHNLILLAYFLYLGGETEPLELMTQELGEVDASWVTFSGRRLPIGHLGGDRWAWMEKQVRRLEQAMFGRTRPEIEGFLVGVVARAGDQRTVGHEHGPKAVQLV